jgi:hypothetical protein
LNFIVSAQPVFYKFSNTWRTEKSILIALKKQSILLLIRGDYITVSSSHGYTRQRLGHTKSYQEHSLRHIHEWNEHGILTVDIHLAAAERSHMKWKVKR